MKTEKSVERGEFGARTGRRRLDEAWGRMKAELTEAMFSRKSQQVKRVMLGRNLNEGLLAKLVFIMLLTVIAFLYIKPILYMVSTSLKNIADLIDPLVQLIPRTLYWGNYAAAWNGLHYVEAFTNTFIIAAVGSVLQVFSCALTGYALGRLRFPGKTLFLFLILLTFLVPPQITTIPLYMIYEKLGLLGTPFVFLVPAVLGQGLRSALFIMIFRQFFMSQPKALEEAAKLDGASLFRLFFRIMLPVAGAACLVVFLFSFVWYWNMSYEASLFLSKDFTPLSLRLNTLQMELMGNRALVYSAGFGSDPISEGPKMAAAFLIIMPPLIVYLIAQRWFTEGIERTGLVD
ncbi:carbohydrate ABC transporter permease [Paenibacillus sp. J5C_2022]|uniref:carbohydrate ABC transporter permease n=1 Tax=Paenibacillus sp. J5C2022 TaxID=2977129 RepID=UPI0021CFCA5D|nr:carbohydrate ABC transporter permease [Paenibacillus sp. J5C2022]MCU6711601.1 carbohydrate ABC transporter permease [Paenibacillus sp. J5C2022]